MRERTISRPRPDTPVPSRPPQALLQRKHAHGGDRLQPNVPSIFDDALSSSGQPLDAATRAVMEQRFGHDFSQVRIHTDTQAAESARAVNALAYTVGRDVVFGAGQYSPQSPTGQQLLAHELTHVRQQTMTGMANPSDERLAEAEADQNGSRLAFGQLPEVRLSVSAGSIQYQKPEKRKPTPKPLDEAAEKIIAVVLPNPKDKRDPQVKAVELVYRILKKYFPGYADKVAGVGFDNAKAEDGLLVEQIISKNKEKKYYGKIWVGDTFVEELIKDKFTFASHVAKVAHELEHIDQWRSGLAGSANKNEREFLAHYHEAIFVEPAGTGRMYHSVRARHLDAALGLFNCLDKKLQKKYENIQQELLTRRPKEVKYGHSEKFPNPPATCMQPKDFGFEKIK